MSLWEYLLLLVSIPSIEAFFLNSGQFRWFNRCGLLWLNEIHLVMHHYHLVWRKKNYPCLVNNLIFFLSIFSWVRVQYVEGDASQDYCIFILLIFLKFELEISSCLWTACICWIFENYWWSLGELYCSARWYIWYSRTHIGQLYL